ncbi:hypothetical protein ACFVMC_13575 [Nocardia sp. NPDC127579]|uniref:hypothetical protein n=1 Tax=Nocardia sp. NPDC127579 TaxID=3345402 RepID=UPI00362C0D33
MPRFVREHVPREVVRHEQVPASQMWESRIDVDEYALYEATHPAYAVQVVELARMVRRHAASVPATMLDVGSGPGLPTVMLTELFPDTRIDAVEPSRAAFPYLVANAAGRRITVASPNFPAMTAIRWWCRWARHTI